MWPVWHSNTAQWAEAKWPDSNVFKDNNQLSNRRPTAIEQGRAAKGTYAKYELTEESPFYNPESGAECCRTTWAEWQRNYADGIEPTPESMA